MNPYRNNIRWKLAFIIGALLILMTSLVYIKYLADSMSEQERQRVETFAQVTHFMSSAGMASDSLLNFEPLLKILESNKTIPIILVSSRGKIIDALNFSSTDTAYYRTELNKFKASGAKPIIIENEYIGKQYIYYGHSKLYTELQLFPIIQMGLLVLLFLLGFWAYTTVKRYEQNLLWVGMAKETAHQLGTPMSSLVAWVQNLRDIFPENLDLVDITDEMDKDLDALKLVAERFSKIGSPPKPTPQNLALLLKKSLDYVVPRAPKTIKYKFPDLANQPEISVMANPMLMDWVFENLLKNALDAMDGKGEIEVSLGIDSKKTGYVEISDTGKGIPKNKWTTIFKPGYTTKTRGWGLGLSLTHRIVVQNHHGKIFVKRSEIDKGTTFRIEIPLAPSKP